MKQIDAIVLSYKKEYQKILIECKIDTVERIELLIEENKKRLDVDYYDYELNKLRLIFETTDFQDSQNKKVVDSYKKAMLTELDEIQTNLQNMIINELNTEIDVEYPYEYHYAFSKLSDSIWGEGYAYAMKDMIVEELNECIQPIAIMNNEMTLSEIYVLFLAANYVKENGM